MKTKKAQSKRKNSKSSTKNSSRKKARNDDSTDVIELILRDHKPLKEFIEILKDAEGDIEEKRPAFQSFAPALTNHAEAEEKSLYVALKDDEDLRMEGFEGDVEHAIAAQLIQEISAIKNDDDKWVAKTKVLAELVEHHIKEEESEVLKNFKSNFDLSSRIEIGEAYSRLMEDSTVESADSRSKNPSRPEQRAH